LGTYNFSTSIYGLSDSLPLPFAAGAGGFLALGSAAAFFASSKALASSRAFDSSHFLRAAASSLIWAAYVSSSNNF